MRVPEPAVRTGRWVAMTSSLLAVVVLACRAAPTPDSGVPPPQPMASQTPPSVDVSTVESVCSADETPTSGEILSMQWSTASVVPLGTNDVLRYAGYDGGGVQRVRLVSGTSLQTVWRAYCKVFSSETLPRGLVDARAVVVINLSTGEKRVIAISPVAQTMFTDDGNVHPLDRSAVRVAIDLLGNCAVVRKELPELGEFVGGCTEP